MGFCSSSLSSLKIFNVCRADYLIGGLALLTAAGYVVGATGVVVAFFLKASTSSESESSNSFFFEFAATLTVILF